MLEAYGTAHPTSERSDVIPRPAPYNELSYRRLVRRLNELMLERFNASALLRGSRGR